MNRLGRVAFVRNAAHWTFFGIPTRSIIFCLSLIFDSCLPSFALADEATISRFATEAPLGWRRIEEAYSGNEFVVEIDNLEGTVPTYFGRKTISQYRGNISVVGEEIEKGKAIDYVKLHNRDYEAFLLKRTDGGWYIAQCKPAVPVGYVRFPFSLPSLRAPIDYHIPSTIIEYGVVDKKHNLAHMLKDASARMDKNGVEIVTAEFLVAIRQEDSEFVVSEEYSKDFVFKVDFLPQQSWCIKRVEYRSPYTGKYISTEAKYSNEGVHPSEILVSVGESAVNEFRPIFREKYSDLSAKTIGADDFRLTSFGLIEPRELVKNHPFLSWPKIVILATGLGIAFFAIRFIFLQRRPWAKR